MGDSGAESDHDDIEDRYSARSKKSNPSAPPVYESSDEDDDANTIPQHESIAGPSKKRDRGPKNKIKYTPLDESKEKRDERTIFVGNLPAEVAKNKVRSHPL